MTVGEMMATLTEDDFETIEELAMLNWSLPDMARKLAVDVKCFRVAFNTPENPVRVAYYRGVQELELVRDAALLDNVRDGNMTAIQIVDRDRQIRKFEEVKSQVFGI